MHTPPPDNPAALIASLIANALLLGAQIGTITAWTIQARRLRRQRDQAIETIGIAASAHQDPNTP